VARSGRDGRRDGPPVPRRVPRPRGDVSKRVRRTLGAERGRSRGRAAPDSLAPRWAGGLDCDP
jgi:hypothetical protein